MTVLLKECRDIQLRCGSSRHDYAEESTAVAAVEVTLNGESDAEKVISDRLVCFICFNCLIHDFFNSKVSDKYMCFG